MKTNHGSSALFLAFLCPLAVLGQRGGRGGGGGWGGGGGRPNPNPPTTIAPAVPIQTQAPNDPPVVVSTQPVDGDDDTPIVTQGAGNGDTINTAPAPVNTETGGGGGGGGGGAGCAAVSGNMNVEVSGDNVDFRFEPPVAGNPTTGKTGDCPVWTFPPGWQGRVHVGGGSGAPNGGTLYEGIVSPDGGSGAMDVSFVEGFSVPMICTDNENGFVAGCAIDLFQEDAPCPTGGSSGGVCANPQGPGGARDSAVKWCWACSPPDPFFGPCAGAAIVFPTDDAGTDGISSLDITCVIGASSQRTGREGSTAETGYPQPGRCEVCTDGTKKRGLDDGGLFGRNKGMSPVVARSPSTLPRVRRRKASAVEGLGKRGHRHGLIKHQGKGIR